MKNINVEEVARDIQDKLQETTSTNPMEFIYSELDTLEIEAKEIRGAITAQIEF